MKYPLYPLFVAMLIFCIEGCKVDELPVPKHLPGQLLSGTINMEPDYKWQIFYNLEKNMIVSQNLRSSWDLGFECNAEGFHVITNVGKYMQVYNTGKTDLLSVVDTTGYGIKVNWDASNGILNETAIGDWRINKPVYILDLGYSETGTHQGFQKIRIVEYSELSYTFEYAHLNCTQANQINILNIAKDSLYNFSFFSFALNSIVNVEPPKKNWDIVFMQYIHVFQDANITPYWVTGCLLNRNNTMAVLDTINPFDNINHETAANSTLSPNIDIIGYNWKFFDGEGYTIRSNYNYLLKDQKGIYYKLHFIDFYSPTGLKGCPTWEFQRL